MSTLINSFDLTPFYIQSGYGIPNHFSTLGSEYTDLDTAIKYVNKNGLDYWVQMVDTTYPFSGGTVTGSTNFTNGLTANTISATTYYNLPTDISITGGTYTTGTTTFTNNTGGTFTVTGYSTGYTLTSSAITSTLGYVPLSAYTDTNITGGTYTTGTAIFTNNTGGTFSVTGFTTPFTGGSVTGATNFTNGLTANTFSATTYQNLPTDIRTTGGTYSNNNFIFSNNTGGTYNVLFNTVTGLTINGDLTITGNTNIKGLSATSISATTITVPSVIANISGLTVNANTTITGTTFLGNGTLTKIGYNTGDILLDNNATDTPGVLFYYGNNSNYGIDSYNGSFDVLSGQLFRITNNLNESGGAVKMAIDTTGNVVVTGFLKTNAWRAGQVIQDVMLSNTEVTVSTTTIATSTSDTDFVTYSYTPLSSSSYLVIHYHLANYDATSGTGNDSWISRIKVDGGEITYSVQNTVNGFRTGVLFPLTGRYTNSNTTAKSIVVACRRASADDSITITNAATSMWLRITEIAR